MRINSVFLATAFLTCLVLGRAEVRPPDEKSGPSPIRVICIGAHPDDAAYMVAVPKFLPEAPALKVNPDFLWEIGKGLRYDSWSPGPDVGADRLNGQGPYGILGQALHCSGQARLP